MRGGLHLIGRGALGGFVLLGVMGLGERAYSKYQLKNSIDLKNKMQEYQIQMELKQLKKTRPGRQQTNADQFGDIEVKSEEELDMMRFELEGLMKSQGMAM